MSLRATAVLVASLLAAPAVVQAQIFKCVTADGRVTYSDSRCPGAASIVEMQIEPNIVEAPKDRGGSPPAGRTEPTPACERALRTLEVARRSSDAGSPAVKAAYEQVVAACTESSDKAKAPGDAAIGPPPGSDAANRAVPPGRAPAGADRSDGRSATAGTERASPRPLVLPLPPGSTERGAPQEPAKR